MPTNRCDHNEGPRHDCGYVDLRNACIPEAEREADVVAGPRPPVGGTVDRWSADWNRAFAAAMEGLVAERLGGPRYVRRAVAS